MTFPDDLPWLLEYRVGSTVRVTLPRRPVEFVSSSGANTSDEVCPQIPLGCTGWRRTDGSEAWKPLEDLPRHWMRFLQRARGTEHDPRPKTENDV